MDVSHYCRQLNLSIMCVLGQYILAIVCKWKSKEIFWNLCYQFHDKLSNNVNKACSLILLIIKAEFAMWYFFIYNKTKPFCERLAWWSFSQTATKSTWHVKLNMVLILSGRKCRVHWSWWWIFQYAHWLLGCWQI